MTVRTSIHAIAGAAAALLLLASPVPGHAQDGVSEEVEGIFIVGSRRAIRSIVDTPTPVAVVQSEDLTQAGVSDVSSLLRTVVPSWNVNTQPISDAATIVRPPNLRGFAPDQSLIFLNGKRRHRSAVISFLGFGVSNGAQGPDVSVIPAIALKRVEVLKDSASAQYGSDAIAGVINFVLKDSPEGGTVETQWGRTYEGDGEEYRISANAGMPMGSAGYLNVSAEFREADPTSRSVQRDDAQALIDAGHPNVRQPYAQVWGRAETRDDYKLFANFGLDSGLYAFGNYAEREVEGGFFFRNPIRRDGVFTTEQSDGSHHFLLADRLGPDGMPVDPAAGCASFNIPTGALGSGDVYEEIASHGMDVHGIDTAGLTRENCFSHLERFPGGYTPSFGGRLKDVAGSVGFRNELDSGLGYDVSLTIGESRVDHFISNTLNPSYGDRSPTAFELGAYVQRERTANADLTYPLDVEIFASPLNVAAGFEWREEEFEVVQGEEASFRSGVYNDLTARFIPGAHGFAGFGSSSTSARSNIALYLDLEADVRDDLTLSTAVRWENFERFGSTTDFKIAALKRMNDWFSIRGGVNTGFRVPTVGQEKVEKTNTAFTTAGRLVQVGILSPTDPLALGVGAVALEPEESTAFSAGFVIDLPSKSLTLDMYNIEVKDRVGLSRRYTSDDFADLPDAENPLHADNNPRRFESIRYFGNGFDTRTLGFDLVSTIDLTERLPGLEQGTTDFVFAFNYTKTKVTRYDPNFLNDLRITQLEEGLPEYRFNGTLRHDRGDWRALVRLNHFGSHTEYHADSASLLDEVGTEYTIDVEAGWRVLDGVELVVGVTNLFNNFPDENPFKGVLGSRYPEAAPGGLDGGFYYARMQYTW